ncbi:MAG: caspase family protein [Bacteroidota bacterium]
MAKSLCLLAALLLSVVLHAQDYEVTPITGLNSNQHDLCLAMLPDSTMLISSYREGTCRCFQMVWKDTTWVRMESRLADMINALMPRTSSEPHFRFSDDFTHVVVTIQEDGPHRYFESVKTNGEWNFFTPINIDPKLDIWHGLAMSSDYSKLYGRAKNGSIYQFDREGESWSAGKRFDVFDQVSKGHETVEDVLTIGSNGVLAHIQYEANKGETKEFQKKYRTNGLKQAYFYTRMQPNGTWTAPMLLPDVHPLADNLVITPNGDWMLFIGPGNGSGYDFGKTPTSKLLRAEIASTRKPQVPVKTEPVATTETQLTNNTQASERKYYALLIGNADYKVDKLDLTKPVLDVQMLTKTLTQHYQFEEQNITQLINADRNAIFSSLQQLRNKITRRDNLLIFYAGHGFWDDVVKQGYWWPVDASPDNAANWLSNSDLREQISGINSAHTLLISDACFSGAIFKQRGGEELKTASYDTQQLYRLRSRRAITSGTLQVVPDESSFIKYLVQFLNDNPDKFLSSSDLFSRMRKSVINNSTTIPQEGVIMNTGDEGGDFIFIKR